MADLFDGPSQHTTGGFQGAPVSKFITGASIVGHVALHVPMFSALKNILHCNLTRIFSNGQFWRIFTSKLVFLDTKDAIFCLILLYQFRVFERRYGSRNFSSRILATSVMTAVSEMLINLAYGWLQENTKVAAGSMAIGPFGIILPLFVNYFCEIPNLGGTNFASISSKSMFYIIGGQVAFSSAPNTIVALSSLIAGLMVRQNFMWVNCWLKIPTFFSSMTDKLLGWMVRCGESSTVSELLGATLEIQRAQTAEVMEQRMLRQQQAMFEERNRRGVNRVGQGFQEQLVNNQLFPQHRLVGGAAGRGVPPTLRTVEPSDENVQMLVDMGFGRERVLQALRQTGNDVQSATALLLQGEGSREGPLR